MRRHSGHTGLCLLLEVMDLLAIALARGRHGFILEVCRQDAFARRAPQSKVWASPQDIEGENDDISHPFIIAV